MSVTWITGKSLFFFSINVNTVPSCRESIAELQTNIYKGLHLGCSLNYYNSIPSAAELESKSCSHVQCQILLWVLLDIVHPNARAIGVSKSILIVLHNVERLFIQYQDSLECDSSC